MWVVQPPEVIGGVAWSAPAAGYWLVYLKLAPGWGSALVTIVGLCLMWSIVRELDGTDDAAVTDLAPGRAAGLELVDVPSS